MIPQSFFKFLKGMKCEHAVLRRGCKKWAVKVNGRHFEDGWKKFAEENNVQVGDFVVFRYEGNMIFKVKVFDPSQCEREYVHRACDVGKVESVGAEEIIWKKHSEKLKFNNLEGNQSTSRVGTKRSFSTLDEGSNLKYSPPPANLEGKSTCSTLVDGLKQEKKPLDKSLDAKGTFSSASDHPFFVSTVKPYTTRLSCLYIPTAFGRSTGLNKRCCEAMIIDSSERPWSVQLVPRAGRVAIRRGWSKFFAGNGLKEGDMFKLELIKKGDKPIMKFHGLAKTPKMTHPAETTACSLSGDYPHFVSTIKAYNIKSRVLYLPTVFARHNGLMRKRSKMMLRDDQQRLWSVVLRHSGALFYIRSGWHDFCIANGLKEGDSYKFELIKTGKTAIANFTLGNFSEKACPGDSNQNEGTDQ